MHAMIAFHTLASQDHYFYVSDIISQLLPNKTAIAATEVQQSNGLLNRLLFSFYKILPSCLIYNLAMCWACSIRFH